MPTQHARTHRKSPLQPAPPLSIQWQDEEFDLFSEKALFWPRSQTAIIADPHFGKAAAFRHAGIPVPGGTTQADLDRLNSVLDRTEAKRLIVLGDFLHARTGRAEMTMAMLEAWRDRYRDLAIVLVRGNHDQDAGDPPTDWRFECVDDLCFEDEGLMFCHRPPAQRRSGKPVIAGHIHPCAVLRDTDGSSMRVPCFFFGRRQAIMPAFGSFTGAHPIEPKRGERIFAIGPGLVTEVSTIA